MLDIDFDDEAIEKLASVICGDDYSDKFCEDIYLTNVQFIEQKHN